MKRTDIAMIILIAAVSAGLAYFVANSLFGGMTEQGVKVKTIDPITSTIESPDPAIFNENAINPSVEVNINNTATDTTTTPTTTPNATTTDTSSTKSQ
jgi:hypothetical protein